MCYTDIEKLRPSYIQSMSFSKKHEELIRRIEDYPCCISCYVTIEELNAAKNMKEAILKIIRGENK